jgi:hypothetical protein
MSRLRKILIACAVPVSLIVTATPAWAYNTPSYWNTSSTPLVASGYGSTARSYGYIKIFNGSNGTRLYSYAWNKFTDADNHRAYLAGRTQFNAGTCSTSSVQVSFKGVSVGGSSSCAQQFYDKDNFTQGGLNYTSSTWTAMPTTNHAVVSGADRGRAVVRMSIDIPLRPDVQSGESYSSADSW